MRCLLPSSLSAPRRTRKRRKILISQFTTIFTTLRRFLAKSKLLKEAVDEGKLTVIEAYYSSDTGEVTKLR